MEIMSESQEKIVKKKLNLKALIWKAFLALLLISVLIYAFNYYDLGSKINRESIEAFLRPFGIWVPIVYVSLFIVSMFFHLPCSWFLIIGGSIFGPVMGVLFGLIGSIGSSLAIFFFARKFDYSAIRSKLGTKWGTFNQKIEKDGGMYIFIIRCTSVFPFALIAYASAFSSIKSRDYVVATILGCFPLAFVHAYIVPTLIISRDFSLQAITPLLLMIVSWLVLTGAVYLLAYKKTKCKTGLAVSIKP